MAIRFTCPSCQQPIEIDDEWGGQSVGCPYCKRVVTAPKSSSWPPGDIPEASSPDRAFQPPPPPSGTIYPPQTAVHASKSAIMALVLAIICTVLCFLGWIETTIILSNLVYEKVGLNASDEQMRQAIQEIVAGGNIPTSPLAASASIIGAICGLGGLILAIKSLLQQETRKGIAIAACIISACFMCCQLPIIMTNLGTTISTSTQPASTQTTQT
ncbi:MAG: hypothetical protein JSV03_03175 [Planctomycetota bacterium]|nr:MAG: hypothetical protein JSV03_03175 [Planctomycetota bacterium]